MLERNANKDVYLRHAGVVSLARSEYQSALANLSTHPNAAVRLAVVLALRKQESQFLTAFLRDSDDAIATEAARAIHDVPIPHGMDQLAWTVRRARTMPWQRRAISAAFVRGSRDDIEGLALFATDTSKTDRMRMVAVRALQTWLDPPDREIVEGRWAPVPNKESRTAERFSEGRLDDKMPDLIASAQGELLTQIVTLAQIHDIPLPEGLSRTLLMDESQHMSLREHCLRHLRDEQAIGYGLNSAHWQLRAAARDVKIDLGGAGLIEDLARVVYGAEVREAQAAISSLGRIPNGTQELEFDELAPDLHLEYWEAAGNSKAFPDPFDGNWLVLGGSPEEGKRVVFEHSAGQCLRCHKIGDHGGIAGPPLDAVGSTMNDRELLEALLIPSKRIAEGFGEYSAMPPVDGVLGHREIRDVVAYLKTLKTE